MAEATKQRGFWKIALACVVLIEVLGGLSGWLSNSGYGNGSESRCSCRPDGHSG